MVLGLRRIWIFLLACNDEEMHQVVTGDASAQASQVPQLQRTRSSFALGDALPALLGLCGVAGRFIPHKPRTALQHDRLVLSVPFAIRPLNKTPPKCAKAQIIKTQRANPATKTLLAAPAGPKASLNSLFGLP